jgi:hypothetical protein
LRLAPWALRLIYTPQGGAIEGNAADDALMVVQGNLCKLDSPPQRAYSVSARNDVPVISSYSMYMVLFFFTLHNDFAILNPFFSKPVSTTIHLKNKRFSILVLFKTPDENFNFSISQNSCGGSKISPLDRRP